jgi:CRM1 C terminal
VQEKLMELPNGHWGQIMDNAATSPDTLTALPVQQTLHNLLQSNVSVCQSMGGYFMPQMVRLYSLMLQVYARYSELINTGIQKAGPLGAGHSTIKSMRSIKKTVLKLIETYVDTTETQEHLAVIAVEFVPLLMEPILTDYERSLPEAKCAPLPPRLFNFRSAIRIPLRIVQAVVRQSKVAHPCTKSPPRRRGALRPAASQRPYARLRVTGTRRCCAGRRRCSVCLR